MQSEAVDVVIVAFQSRGDLSRILPTLVGHHSIGRVVVVDHGLDGSGTLARSLGADSIVDEKNPGFGAGQNRGIERCSSRLVLLLNPDLLFDPSVLVHSTQVFDDESVAMAQGVIRSQASGRPERSAGDILGPVHLLGRLLRLRALLWAPGVARLARSAGLSDHVDRVPADVVEVEWLAATAVLCRREALLSVGGFDDRLFLYGEDLDICTRLRAAGWRLLALPTPWALHRSGGSSSNQWERELSWWEGTLGFAAMHWSGPRWLAALLIGAARAATLALRRPSRAKEVCSRLVGGARRLRADRVL